MSQAPSTIYPNDGIQHGHYQRPASSPPLATSSSPINSGNHGALYARLRTQVEFYFSPQNLARDTYLRNMLTANHKEVPSPPPLQLITPVAVITNFPKVKDICASFGTALSDPPHVLLARACEGSTVVTISSDGAWIGPASQVLPPLMTPSQRMAPSQPQSLFQRGPYPPSPHQRITTNLMGEVRPMPYVGPQPVPVAQNAPLSHGSGSPSSNSLDSTPSQVKEVVVLVTDMPMECNPIQLMAAFTTDTVRPKSVSADGSNNIWLVTFVSDADAKAAIVASSEKTIAGAPIKAKLKSDPNSAKVSVASASGASLSSMSETHRQSHLQVLHHPAGHQMVQPVTMPGGAVMYPPGAYPIPQPSPPPLVQPGVPPYSLGPHYSMTPMPLAGIPGQPFPPYPQQMQPMYPYYMPQQGQPPFPMTQLPMSGRYGPVVPPPPPRYPGPFYPYQHGPQQHNMGDNFGHHHGPPSRQHTEARGLTGHFHEGGQKKSDHGGKKKKNRFQRRDDPEGGSTQQSNQHGFVENSSSPNNFVTHGKGRGRQGDNFRRSTGSPSPAFNRNQRNNTNKLSNSVNQASADVQQDCKEDIFSAADFPGLGGEMKSRSDSFNSGALGQKYETKKLSGYADALLKKSGKGKESEPVREASATKEAEKVDVDIVSRETEPTENDMLSDFNNLQISGSHGHHSYENNAGKDGGKDGDSCIADGTSKKTCDHLPILPGMSDIGQSFSVDIESKSVQSKALHHSPKESEESHMAHHTEPSATLEPSPMIPRATETSVTNAQDKQVVSGAWGSKRLFSDVIKDKE